MSKDVGYKLAKAFWIFNFGMAAYGFTRGLRSNYDTAPRKILVSERIVGSFANSLMYFTPVWNIYQFYRLFNRIEIRARGLKQEDYKNAYLEPFSGYCFHTL